MDRQGEKSKNQNEIVINISYRRFAQQTMIPKNANREHFKDQISRSTIRTGIILNKDQNGNYISEIYEYQQNQKRK